MIYGSRDIAVSGMKYEYEVTRKLNTAFENQDFFGINGYPMHHKDGCFHREVDVLFVHRELGIFNIEVKGIKINEIDFIIGNEWHMIPTFHSKTIQPFHQAMQQTYMLEGNLKDAGMLKKSERIKTVVALPEITKAEWQARGFDKQPNLPMPLLKDDFLTKSALIAKMKHYDNNKKSVMFSSERWQEIQKFFQVDNLLVDKPINSVEKYINYEGESTEKPLFSQLLIIHTAEEWDAAKIVKKLKSGIKIYLFLTDPKLQRGLRGTDEFVDKNQLEVFILKKSLPGLKINDGKMSALQKTAFANLTKTCEWFNAGQYQAIHAGKDSHQAIIAGAGTGKTHVMIDRILYLHKVWGTALDEIIMLTFTNQSTNEMRNRLEDRLITLAQLTGSSAYLLLAEDVANMQISTIHSYAKTVIETLAHELGYGKNIKLRSFTNEKYDIIKDLIDKYLTHMPDDFFKVYGIQHFELHKYIVDLWKEFEKNGLSKEEIKEKIDWGDVEAQSQPLANLFKYVFAHCETALEKRKRTLNAIAMNDVIRKLKTFTAEGSLALKQLKQDCYLFIDEFQDSDDVQIAFIAQLQRIANYKLFVVGDVKQSIYRFRGADYRSFDELKRKLGANATMTELTLRINYRSSQNLLSEMDKYFMSWGQQEPQLLPYSEETRLRSNIQSQVSDNWEIVNPRQKQTKQEIKKWIRKALQDVDGTENKQVALLVYSNQQAGYLQQVCEEINIPTVENLDGTFYTTLAVRHFHSLLLALLYPNNLNYMIEGLNTPYFNAVIKPHSLLKALGNRAKLNEMLKAIKDETIMPYVEKLKEYSVLSVIQLLIAENNTLHYLKSYFMEQGQSEEMADHQAQTYILYLQHLLLIIEKTFSTQQLTLYTLVTWLNLQISTNRNENTPIVENSKAKTVISTVHRAKGLEFDTVIMPMLNAKYGQITNEFYIEDKVQNDGSRKVGWIFKMSQKVCCNNYYSELSKVETLEERKEQARLLYVALTRAKQRVVLFMSTGDLDTWSGLLQQAQRGVK
ncbi:hypothetical protein CH76_12075 [Lysinibacillus sp. BF-4]|uniref:UvrD-helicase domain-containing protein n=1 Tax=Lysinibacillus sp. BF-4 TaxID=1473546 RepID=UPI00050745F6|nr:UvrD-helicase domain-containing protein [Lysinibacillus sp. BF-4]KFL42493.1 hypothetical protein CH76_12075 [Lysinibacillus sp. BF-4]